ncbi:hypothetical protein D9M71_558350 [compost metagenome]
MQVVIDLQQHLGAINICAYQSVLVQVSQFFTIKTYTFMVLCLDIAEQGYS